MTTPRKTTLATVTLTLILGLWLGASAAMIALAAGMALTTVALARERGCPECRKLNARRTLTRERHGGKSWLYTYRCRFCSNAWTRRIAA